MPEPQDNLRRAAALGFDAVDRQPAEQLAWLGAQAVGQHLAAAGPGCGARRGPGGPADHRPRPARRSRRPGGFSSCTTWRSSDGRRSCHRKSRSPICLPRARTRASISSGPSPRLCATAGRDAERFRTAALAVGGRRGDRRRRGLRLRRLPAAFRAGHLVRRRRRVPPSATLLLPRNIEAYLCIEDIVVLSERLVSRSAGAGCERRCSPS